MLWEEVFEFSQSGFVSLSRISSMSFAHQEAGQDCPTWSKGPWRDKSHLSSVLVSLTSFVAAVLFSQFSVLFCHCVTVSLCFQVKAGMGRCGGGLGWGRAWLSKSSPLGTNSPGSERQRSIIPSSYDMTTFWAS